MSLSAEETWSRILDRARIELSEQIVATWLTPLTPDSLDDQTLTVTAPDQWSVEWNEQKHGAILERLAPVALGHPLRISFRVQSERVKRAQMDLFTEPAPRNATGSGAIDLSSPNSCHRQSSPAGASFKTPSSSLNAPFARFDVIVSMTSRTFSLCSMR